MEDGVASSAGTPINPLLSSPPVDIPSPDNLPVLSRWFLIFLLIIFPPLAWYLMYKDKHYHHWFPVLLYIYGAFLIISMVSMQIFVIPPLIELYSTMGIKVPLTLYAAIPIAIIIAAVMIIFGVILGMKNKAGKENKLLFIAAIIFIFSYVYFILAIFSIIHPIYSLVSQIK